MYTVSHDYYGILGVSKNATTEEISEQYKKLMKKHHPDQFKGMRAKYQGEGDQDLLRVIDEKIREAEEMCKLLNEAFEVLSDPVKRKEYDNQVVEPSVPLPEISVHPTRITFGSLTEGQKKSLGFTVENKGGPPAAVNIDWEGDKPGWGELVIEPDEEKVFPIKVTVKVDTTGIPSGPKDEKILVDVDGRIHMVEVFLAVTRPVAASAAPARTPTRASSPPTPPAKTSLTVSPTVGAILIIILTFVIWGIWQAVNSANQQALLERLRQRQSATQVALRSELSLIQVSNIYRTKCDVCPYGWEVSLGYTVTNNSGVTIAIADDTSQLFYIRPATIEPGQTVAFETLDNSSALDGGKLVPALNDTLIASRLCLNFWTEQTVETDISLRSNGGYSAWLGVKSVGPFTVCKDIPSELAPP